MKACLLETDHMLDGESTLDIKVPSSLTRMVLSVMDAPVRIEHDILRTPCYSGDVNDKV